MKKIGTSLSPLFIDDNSLLILFTHVNPQMPYSEYFFIQLFLV